VKQKAPKSAPKRPPSFFQRRILSDSAPKSSGFRIILTRKTQEVNEELQVREKCEAPKLNRHGICYSFRLSATR